jgi:hypothetical protein
MKKLKKGLVAVIGLLTFSAAATLLVYSDSNGNVWRIDSNDGTNRVFIVNIGSGVVGSHTNYYQGHKYWINPTPINALIKDDTNTVGKLYWTPNNIWDVSTHYGFCIETNGTAWLVTAGCDDCNVHFLTQVDLATGGITNYHNIDTGTPLAVKGLAGPDGVPAEPGPEQ